MAGINVDTLSDLEAAKSAARNKTLRALEDAYGQERGELDRIAADADASAAPVPPELADKPDVVDAVRRRFPDPATQERMLEAMARAARGEPPATAGPGGTGQSAPSGRERQAG